MLAQRNIHPGSNIAVRDYIDNMDLCLMACDVVISRAGGSFGGRDHRMRKSSDPDTCSKCYGKSPVLQCQIGRRQRRSFLIEEKDLDIRQVVEDVLKLMNDRQLLNAMSQASRACAPVRSS